MQIYAWRIVAGILVGYFGTWALAVAISLGVLFYRIPQVISCIKKGEILYLFGIFFATKAMSFLIPLWLTVLLVNGDAIITHLSGYLGTNFGQVFIRTH